MGSAAWRRTRNVPAVIVGDLPSEQHVPGQVPQRRLWSFRDDDGRSTRAPLLPPHRSHSHHTTPSEGGVRALSCLRRGRTDSKSWEPKAGWWLVRTRMPRAVLGRQSRSHATIRVGLSLTRVVACPRPQRRRRSPRLRILTPGAASETPSSSQRIRWGRCAHRCVLGLCQLQLHPALQSRPQRCCAVQCDSATQSPAFAAWPG